tara:strand:- start:2999 stop:4678 length:1680 start_codon:yes stop_codon:yes gene_type:complete
MKNGFYKLKENYVHISCLSLIILYFIPFFASLEHSFFNYQDNFDYGFLMSEFMTKNNLLFLPSNFFIDELGVTRLSLGSEFNIIHLLTYFLRPHEAYIFMQLLIKVVAYFGMFFFIRNHVSKNQENVLLIFGISLCFCLLPFYGSNGLSIAGIPLFLNSILKIKKNINSSFDWLCILIIPFTSSFITTYFFLLGILFFLYLYNFLRNKHFNFKYLFILIFVTFIFFLIEYRLILENINPSFIPHRIEFIWDNGSFAGATYRGLLNFIYGHPHAPSHQTYFIIPSIFVSLILLKLNPLSIYKNKFLFYLLLVFLFSVNFGFWYWDRLLVVKEFIPFLKTFNITRFTWLSPFIWMILFYMSASIIKENNFLPKESTNFFLVLLISSQIIFSGIFKHEYLTSKERYGFTYSQFVEEDLFREIKDHIEKPTSSFKVISLGIHPIIALHNDLKTYDFYLTYYPLEKKNRFFNAFSKELEKDINLLNYFKNWGNRLYLFNEVTGKNFYSNNSSRKIENIEMNKKILIEDNVQYLISKVPIENGLAFEKKFESKQSYWTLYLYKIF